MCFGKLGKLSLAGAVFLQCLSDKRGSVLPHGAILKSLSTMAAKGPGGWPTKNGTSNKSGGGRNNNPPKGK